jgi:hypothetical protein
LVSEFEQRRLLDELTGHRRNRVYRYTPFLEKLAQFRRVIRSRDDRVAIDVPATAAALNEAPIAVGSRLQWAMLAYATTISG